jgi:hypothetical protein
MLVHEDILSGIGLALVATVRARYQLHTHLQLIDPILYRRLGLAEMVR